MLQRGLSKKWKKAHEQHMVQQKEKNKETKTTPMSSLIRQLCRVTEELWKTRNKNKHGTNPKERKEAERNKLNPKIQKILQRPIHAHDATIQKTTLWAKASNKTSIQAATEQKMARGSANCNRSKEK